MRHDSPTKRVIRWLESPEGEQWSRARHTFGSYVNNLAVIKTEKYSEHEVPPLVLVWSTYHPHGISYKDDFDEIPWMHWEEQHA